MISEIAKNVATVLGAAVAIVVATQKTTQYFSPIRVAGGIKIIYANSSPGEILATVVNQSSKPIYLQSCKAREVKNIKRLLIERTRCELYKKDDNFRDEYDIKSYNLLKQKPLKLEPSELVNLSHKLYFNYPFAGFFNHHFVIEATLTNGRIFKSKRVKVPVQWLFKVKNY